MRKLLHSLFILLLLAGALPAAAKNFCAEIFPAVRAPLNRPDLYRDLALTSNVVFKAADQHHVFNGDLSYTRIRGAMETHAEQVGIEGGMHMRQALDRFLEMRPDIQEVLHDNPSLQTLASNGVLKVLFPQDAFASQMNMTGSYVQTRNGLIKTGKKSFFPETWTKAVVVEAIRTVLKTGKIQKDPNDPPARMADGKVYRVVGIYQGVRVVVVIRNNAQVTVISAYPANDQTMTNR